MIAWLSGSKAGRPAYGMAGHVYFSNLKTGNEPRRPRSCPCHGVAAFVAAATCGLKPRRAMISLVADGPMFAHSIELALSISGDRPCKPRIAIVCR